MEGLHSKSLRANILAGFFAMLLILLIVRMFYMQTFQYRNYLEISEENRIRIVPEIAVRGKIFDRYGNLIVDNRPSYVVAAVPNEVTDVKVASANLADLLSVSPDRIESKIRKSRSRRHQPVRLKRDAPFETVCRIEEASSLYPGVVLQLNQSRNYPENGSAAHLLGYLSEITEEELDEFRSKGFHSGSLIGRKGVEREYDDFLRGIDGTRFLEVSAEGRIIGPLETRDPVEPIPGYSLKLGLDYDLQQFAESLFIADTLTGAAVALDPNNGHVLAFVSEPSFDANLFTGPLSPEDWKRLSTDERHPLLNRCIQATYPPGSIYKLIVAGAALEANTATPDTKFLSCTGGYRYGNRIFKCHKLSGHGILTMIDAIAASCDVYFYQLGKELGLKNWAEYSRMCGFGKPTGIDLDDEAAGLIPDKEYYDNRHGEGRWPSSLILNLAIGQGELLVTPLQMAQFYAALANGGTIYKPKILYSLVTPEGEIQREPEVAGELPFKPSTIAVLDSAATDVVNGRLGTAGRARVKGIVVCGKTGTAQNPHGNEHAWFCAYAPRENPRIAIACIVENAGHGGAVAAPIVGNMIERYLKNIGVIMDSIPIPEQFMAQESEEGETNEL